MDLNIIEIYNKILNILGKCSLKHFILLSLVGIFSFLLPHFEL